MNHKHRGFGIAISIAALVVAAGCGGQPPAEKTEAAAPATEVAAGATNAVEAATNTVAAATNTVAAATNTVEAATNTVAAAAPAAAAPAAGAVVLAVTDAAGATLSGDATKGKAVFNQCMTCHVVTLGVNKVGPSLAGIVGRAAGSVPGFRYSEANKGSGITWSEQELYVYLENPKAKIPGTTMAFVGIKDSQKRADLIAYLKSPT